jgi:hypothetical protein
MDPGRVIPGDPLDFIRSCVRERKLLWTYHVQMRLAGRSVPRMVILDNEWEPDLRTRRHIP